MNVSEELNLRERMVLDAIVRNYILTAAPTSSRFLAKQHGFDWSAATIRNIMGDLEEKGFIEQPHTSAGRIPSDVGYRYYVDTMMEHSSLPQEQRVVIDAIVKSADPTDLHLVMDATARALSVATHQLGVMLAPRLAQGVFRHIHIFEIEPHRYVLHLTVDAGFVRTLTVELVADIQGSRLYDACQVLNQRFYGKPLEAIVSSEKQLLNDVAPLHQGVIRLFIPSIKKLLSPSEEQTVHAEGTTNIVLKPDFIDRDQLGAVIEILGERKMLMHLFNSTNLESDKVLVSIGGENKNGVLESFSILKTRYQVGNLEGTLGIIGPKRMPYPLLVSAVDYTAKLLGELHPPAGRS